MNNTELTLVALEEVFAICQLAATEEIPAWSQQNSSFISITRTAEELSIVCPESFVPDGIKAELGWKTLKVKGQLDFSLTGILSSIAEPLAKNGISIFAISSYDTDYVLVKQEDFNEAINILSNDFKIE
ncbi:ACT domain-containing protein [Orenia marismortui]|uniref:Uncharacterized protein n=1 Tax=Orenia marismortui TaxID=46469 RepID=A0A4R8GWL5_9FIRM|nr:ACT domain-containing protein [Orenia marismortui]TDX46337.1 hypothetical protein C7959_1424 [Orenia marismortui]